MHTMRKFFSPWKALVAAIAVFASAGSAQAGLTLSLSGVTTSPLSVSNGSTGTLTSIANDFTVKYTVFETYGSVVSPFGSLVRTLSVQLEVTNTSASVQNLTATLSGNGLYGPANGTGYLVAGIQATSLTGTVAGGFIANNTSKYGDSDLASVNTMGLNNVPLYSSPTQITISNPYKITSTTTEFLIGAGSKVVLTSSTQVYGVPEPSGIAAALAGVPCLGLLLGTIRRRLTGNSAPVV